MKTYLLTVEADSCEDTEFVDWLNANGHDATIGDQNTVGGIPTNEVPAKTIMNNLWETYCNA